MTTTVKKIAGVAGSAVLLAGMGMSGAAALSQVDQAVAAPSSDVEASADAQDALNAIAEVKGAFSFTQSSVAPASVVADVMGKSAKYLCGAAFQDVLAAEAHAWSISVSGDVAHAYTATIEQMAEDGAAQITMGCACAGNPIDGKASVNADVSGITIASIVEHANPAAGANTVVFSSSDGYEVALPLNYVLQRYSMIVYAIDGQEICDNVGGANQLWLGSTSGRYFVRNVDSISFEVRDKAPAAPGTAEAGDTYSSLPNISVVYGGAAA